MLQEIKQLKIVHVSNFLVNHIIVYLCTFQNVIDAQNNDEMSVSSIFESSTHISFLNFIIPPF